MAAFLSVASVAACVQMPTEDAGTVDLRPRVGFSVPPGIDLSAARVTVDGLDAGPLSDFREGRGALAMLPGTHLIQVLHNGQTIHRERVFLSDGARRNLLIESPR
ncbi:MAG: hypothetical protein EOO22_02450 [Comamonadaceae bacterium]|nr:MAG: hypothetical protein EOO22_02450 [Comamonadaceae bacterium]